MIISTLSDTQLNFLNKYACILSSFGSIHDVVFENKFCVKNYSENLNIIFSCHCHTIRDMWSINFSVDL